MTYLSFYNHWYFCRKKTIMKQLLFTSILLLFANHSNAQWVEQGCGYTDQYGFVNSVSVPTQGVIWLGIEQSGWNNLQRKGGVSTDGGVTWSFFEIDTLSEYAGLKVKGLNADTAFASLIRYPIEDTSRIYRTVDGGLSWDLIPTAFNGAYEACIDFHFFDGNEGVAFGAPILGPMTVYRTIDAGSTWSKVQAQNLPVPLTQEGMFIFSGNGSYGVSGDNIWLGTTKGRIYKSSDRGQNWDAHIIDTTITIHSVAFKDDNNGVAICSATALASGNLSNRVYTTSDGGITWTQSMNVPNNPRMGNIQYLPGSADSYITVFGWNINGKGTQISTDGGVTWNVHSLERIVGAEFLSETYGWGGGITSTSTEGIFRWDGIASNDELNLTSSLIYPTISADRITILSDHVSKVECYDQMGAKMEVQLIENSIDVTHLSNGVYFLLIEDEKGVSRQTFVVNKN